MTSSDSKVCALLSLPTILYSLCVLYTAQCQTLWNNGIHVPQATYTWIRVSLRREIGPHICNQVPEKLKTMLLPY